MSSFSIVILLHVSIRPLSWSKLARVKKDRGSVAIVERKRQDSPHIYTLLENFNILSDLLFSLA